MNHKTHQKKLAHGMQAGRINIGTVHFDARDADWTLLQMPDDLHQQRRYQRLVMFDEPFETAPHIHLGLSSMDVYRQRNCRLSVDLAAITRESFTIEVRTWWDSKVWGASVNWLAVPLA